jgi:flavin-dependent dehydrogenase
VTAPHVIVLGAGLAGAACAAILAAQGCRPRLVAPDGAVPARGETLSARAAASLDALGWGDLLVPPLSLPGGDRFSVWGGPRLTRSPPPPGEHGGWHVDRPRLEAAVLSRLAAAGVERLVAAAESVGQSSGGVTVALRGGGVLEADFLADCTGRAALTTAPGDRRRLDRLTACHASLPLDDEVEAAAATLVEAVAEGWWYSSPGPDGGLTVSFFSDSDLLPAGISKDPAVWAGLVAATSATAARLESLGVSLADALPRLASAATIMSANPVTGRIVRAGDAVAALDPLASNGLAAALWSGVAAARGLLGLAEGSATAIRRYEDAVLGGVLGQLRSQADLYRGEPRFRSDPFWIRRSQWAADEAPGSAGDWAAGAGNRAAGVA